MSEPRVADLLRRAVEVLRDGGIDNAAGDARHLVAAALGLRRDRLTLHMGDPTGGAAAALEPMLARRVAGMPVSRILERRAFYGRDFIVGPDVLDPRPETEIIVEQSLVGRFSSVLDLGTGSGCILVSLLAERPAARGTGVDISEGALAVARRNAAQVGVEARATFLRSDWWEGVNGQYDLIVSNPPYIAESEMPDLAREVRDHDPHIALSDGADGLNAYRAIAAGLHRHLAPGGRVLVEIGPTQGAAVQALFAAAGLTGIRCLPDLDGRDRVIAASAPQQA
ncbi:peptide chain release factor N(5)-glutamine methyltransferase [Oceaniglobus trochenteri]|uniref:peptide chain release factor N(5)-glutamine methyltransferase n=1 Tax=Oceaniglobus trochenteri TaxID=2763260 RepID=UPI001CFF7B7A|nr:peptide chain release factor N(5)-glutamine methyltransferase [Oceaniglobus trochenteri]